MTRTTNHDKALAAFIAKKAEIDAMLERIATLSADHFNRHPEAIAWPDVTDISDYAKLLKELTDRAFREGEYAPDAR